MRRFPLAAVIALTSCGPTRQTTTPAEAQPPSPPVACHPDGFGSPEQLHLGDGVHDVHFFFIAEELARNPGSPERTREVEGAERAARASSGPSRLKPPSANIVETQFSHLLGVVAEANGGIGAAVYDTDGLLVGATGAQVDGVVLDTARRDAVLALSATAPPLTVKYGCARPSDIHCPEADAEAGRCQRIAIRCERGLVAFYRPVFSGDRVVGVGVLTSRDLPTCPQHPALVRKTAPQPDDCRGCEVTERGCGRWWTDACPGDLDATCSGFLSCVEGCCPEMMDAEQPSTDNR